MKKNKDKILEHLKSRVKYEYDWKPEKQLFPTDDFVQNKPDVEIKIDKNMALTTLLYAGVVFTNDHMWEDDWPKDAKRTISINVNTNDVLIWGCADASEMEYREIADVYDHWEKDPVWGTAVWYCKKENMMPQKPVAEKIRKAGIWNIDSMGLQPNPTDSDFA